MASRTTQVTLKRRADDLGREYKETQATMKPFEDDLSATKDSIKNLARREGEEYGKQTVVIGDEYVVGFTTTDPSPTINQEKLFRLRPDLIAHITSPTIDPTKLKEAVDKGYLTRQELAKCMDRNKDKAQERIYVETLETFNEGQIEAAKAGR